MGREYGQMELHAGRGKIKVNKREKKRWMGECGWEENSGGVG